MLMRDAKNAELYGPLQSLYEEGKVNGTDVWIHKNRMSGLWGPQTALDLYLQEKGITSLLFAGVNADQVSIFCFFQTSVAFEIHVKFNFETLVRTRNLGGLLLQRLRLHHCQGWHRNDFTARWSRKCLV